jgi:hypothetical protein
MQSHTGIMNSGHGGGQGQSLPRSILGSSSTKAYAGHARESKAEGKAHFCIAKGGSRSVKNGLLCRERTGILLTRSCLASCMMYGGNYCSARPLMTRAAHGGLTTLACSRESIASHRVFAVSWPNNLALPLSLTLSMPDPPFCLAHHFLVHFLHSA